MSVNSKFDALVFLSNVGVIAVLGAFGFAPPPWVAGLVIALLLVGPTVEIFGDLQSRTLEPIHTYFGFLGTLLLWIPILLDHIVAIPKTGVPQNVVIVSTDLGVVLLVIWAVLPWLRAKRGPS